MEQTKYKVSSNHNYWGVGRTQKQEDIYFIPEKAKGAWT